MSDRLTNHQIILMRSLIMRGGNARPITIERWQRAPALPLWRRGLIEVWYRQIPDEHPSLRGPYYALTIVGTKIASSFV